mmetsp:Transcript_27060/g.67988  ORF Transcript_27060/g.67988 Transcript_27060/m.67988 type:complete len:249 (-) Transcript_27060:1465-2211(-)
MYTEHIFDGGRVAWQRDAQSLAQEEECIVGETDGKATAKGCIAQLGQLPKREDVLRDGSPQRGGLHRVHLLDATCHRSQRFFGENVVEQLLVLEVLEDTLHVVQATGVDLQTEGGLMVQRLTMQIEVLHLLEESGLTGSFGSVEAETESERFQILGWNNGSSKVFTLDRVGLTISMNEKSLPADAVENVVFGLRLGHGDLLLEDGTIAGTDRGGVLPVAKAVLAHRAAHQALLAERASHLCRITVCSA